MMTNQSKIDLDKTHYFKVISGGQTGVDQAALKAARDVGLTTGGYAPKNFKTEVGYSPWLAEAYGMVECSSEDYMQRTRRNVNKSDATLILCMDQDSPGTKATILHCKNVKMPYYIIDLSLNVVDVYDVLGWLKLHNVQTLNVAGNRESKNPGVFDLAYKVLYSIFLEVKNHV